MFKKVMIAYDESPEAARALQAGIELARAVGAELKVITVLEPIPSYYSFAVAGAAIPVEGWEKDQQSRAEGLRVKAQKAIADAGIFPEVELIGGNEVSTILGCAKNYHADLLVLGMRRHHGWLRNGHTAHDIAQASPCAVLGVR